MKLSAVHDTTTTPEIIFACDVSKEKIHLHTQIEGQGVDLAFANRTASIESSLKALKRKARDAGHRQILLVCESTGCYHVNLLQTARRLDWHTAWVSTEAVAKMRLIETNDSGKTDHKDPRVIHTLARLGKTLQHRVLPELYSLLRTWNQIYEAADQGVVAAKCALHHQLRLLFPDFGFKKDFLYSASGQALVELYGANPYRILRSGNKRFSRRMRQRAPRIQLRSLKRLFEQAQSSAQAALSSAQAELIEHRLRQLWQDYRLHQQRKQEAQAAMENLYTQVCQDDPALPPAHKGVITTFHLARIVAETGPWRDFQNWRKLYRFAGLNLCERHSGQYRGKTRISKKGRRQLRKILSQVVLPLVKRDRLYGPYDHHKREQEKMPGSKAMTAVSRKVLKMLWGWYRSGQSFDRRRVFRCQSQHRLAA